LRGSSPSDAASVLSDVLPSLLGWPDDVSFGILAGYLYHPEQVVRRYAMTGLSYWPEDAALSRLLALLRTNGPTDSLVRFLTRQPEFRAAHSAEIVQAALPFLASESPVVLGGAVAALGAAAREDAAVREAVLKSAEHVVSISDTQTGSALASAISAIQDERSHAILRGLLEKGYKQVAYALSISEQTVKNHMSSILRKLAVNDRTQAVVYAMRQGWIRMPED
jgi:DNA-binding CsgD family transcriptional regulator